MRIAHLTSSAFFGGPERQILGLCRALPPSARSAVMSFAEGGRCDEFLKHAHSSGVRTVRLENDTPNLPRMIREVRERLAEVQADLLCCHGYKANLIGLQAARHNLIPAIAVSRGWTGESLKIRLYESLDRFIIRRFDRIVCVSDGQADKVRRAGVAPEKVRVIRNAARTGFPMPSPRGREKLEQLCLRPAGNGRLTPHATIVLAAARLSPEKGVDVLIDAARLVHQQRPEAHFLVCGDGPQRRQLQRQIESAGLGDVFTLAGYRADLDELLPNADLMVLPSYTEGLPNAVLEACACAVPVVATAVGGTPEVVIDGVSGFLVPPGQPGALAKPIIELLGDRVQRQIMGAAGRTFVREQFTFTAQARQYLQLFESLRPAARVRQTEPALA